MHLNDFRHWRLDNDTPNFDGAIYLKSTKLDTSAQLNIETTLVNETEEAIENGYLIFAVYQNDFMTDVRVFHQTFAADSHDLFKGEDLKSGDSVKVMLWNSEMQPIDFLEFAL